jgi:hypothetical protein
MSGLMRIRSQLQRHLCAGAALVLLAAPVRAQTIDDGVMVAGRELLTGNSYTFDTWDEYWEGVLKRTNANIGTITTKVNVWHANYGLADRLNVIGMVPYVWTTPSQGVLHGFQGFQDLTLALKWKAIERSSSSLGSLGAFAVVSAGIPLTDYNPELLPLSIGLGSTRVSWRGTVNYHMPSGWFINESAAYSWRSQVQLDRPYFFTGDEFTMSDRADMPNAVDHVASAGYMKPRLMLAAFLSQQFTLGGGDIRRQDMPFVSNRMNFSKAGVMAMLPIPKTGGFEVQASVAQTFAGRNVGRATTLTAGLLYRFNGSNR